MEETILAEGGHSRSASYHTYKDLKCAYPRRVQSHKAPGGALPCCWGTCCTAPTPLQDWTLTERTEKRGNHVSVFLFVINIILNIQLLWRKHKTHRH